MAQSLHKESGCIHRIGMVVDDDDLVRQSVVALLEDVCDEVYQAADGIEGLDVLRNHPDISVVVTDIAMPRLDGIGFVCRARRMRPDLKVLFLSGLQRPPPRESFLAKPFLTRAFMGAVHDLLEAN